MTVNQWKVSEDGLEVAGEPFEYFIEMAKISRLTERNGIQYYEWPLHMAIKQWVDIEAFLTAFEKALEALEDKEGAPINQKALANSFSKARELASLRPKTSGKVMPD
ncbi:MAG: hypothetical protein ABIU05_01000 [Nitrospirales bacterium]